MMEYRFMERGNQGRALPTRGDVATAEVCDHVDANALCQPRGVVQLDGEAALGAMAYRLSMAADGGDGFRGDASSGDHFVHCAPI